MKPKKGLIMLGFVPQPNLHQLELFYPNCGNFIALIGNWRALRDLIGMSRNIRKVGVASQWLPVPNGGKIVPDTL